MRVPPERWWPGYCITMEVQTAGEDFWDIHYLSVCLSVSVSLSLSDSSFVFLIFRSGCASPS